MLVLSPAADDCSASRGYHARVPAHHAGPEAGSAHAILNKTDYCLAAAAQVFRVAWEAGRREQAALTRHARFHASPPATDALYAIVRPLTI